MRFPVVFLGLSLLLLGNARAQQQEDKLIDRILRPNLSLSNPAQDKKFEGTGTTSINKTFVAKSFSSDNARLTKEFAGSKSFTSREFAAQKFSRSEKAALAKANAEAAFARVQFQTEESSLVRNSSAQGKAVKTSDYPDERPFRGKGTRQDILSKQNQPLTIEQVRDLLNKGN